MIIKKKNFDRNLKKWPIRNVFARRTVFLHEEQLETFFLHEEQSETFFLQEK